MYGASLDWLANLVKERCIALRLWCRIIGTCSRIRDRCGRGIVVGMTLSADCTNDESAIHTKLGGKSVAGDGQFLQSILKEMGGCWVYAVTNQRQEDCKHA